MKTYNIETYYIAKVLNQIEAESAQSAYEQVQEHHNMLTHSQLLEFCPNGLVWSDAEAFDVSKSSQWTQVEIDINA